jgi:hypothetical protein
VSPWPSDGRDPICPVCLERIKASDKVHGLHDDLMHMGCDYTHPDRTKPPPRPS